MKFQYIVLIMIISVVSATAGTFYLLKNDIAGEVIAFAEPTKEFTTKPVQILTNLKQDSRPRFVRAQISVGVNSEKGLKKLEENEVALKDLCIIQFNETTVEQLNDSESVKTFKEKLKSKIEERFNINVENIYFTELAIQ